jgi:hypothetical protein
MIPNSEDPKTAKSSIPDPVRQVKPEEEINQKSAVSTSAKSLILDPTNPQLDLEMSTMTSEISPARFGAKKILSSVSSVCQRLNNLILKVVSKVFPWNRRARRRLAAAKSGGDPEAAADEEE